MILKVNRLVGKASSGASTGTTGTALGQLRLAPGQTRNLRVRFIYPADAPLRRS